MKHFGSVVGVKPEKVARYKELHAAAWVLTPSVRAADVICRFHQQRDAL